MCEREGGREGTVITRGIEGEREADYALKRRGVEGERVKGGEKKRDGRSALKILRF